MFNDVNHFSLEELEELFEQENDQQSSTGKTDEPGQPQPNNTDDPNGNEEDNPTKTKDIDTTKAFAKRLRESTEKARNEEREAIAKQFGFESYDAMQKSKMNKVIEEQGLDPQEVSPLIEKLVTERLESDPRMKELEGYRKQQIADFAKKELAEISELTNGEVTELSQLSPEVRELWVKKGSLKAAYLELEGENLVRKMRREQSKGTTQHMAGTDGAQPAPSGKRSLNDQERKLWRFFNPQMTDEELSKVQVDN